MVLISKVEEFQESDKCIKYTERLDQYLEVGRLAQLL